jgi:hypothetical protein
MTVIKAKIPHWTDVDKLYYATGALDCPVKALPGTFPEGQNPKDIKQETRTVCSLEARTLIDILAYRASSTRTSIRRRTGKAYAFYTEVAGEVPNTGRDGQGIRCPRFCSVEEVVWSAEDDINC